MSRLQTPASAEQPWLNDPVANAESPWENDPAEGVDPFDESAWIAGDRTLLSRAPRTFKESFTDVMDGTLNTITFGGWAKLIGYDEEEEGKPFHQAVNDRLQRRSVVNQAVAERSVLGETAGGLVLNTAEAAGAVAPSYAVGAVTRPAQAAAAVYSAIAATTAPQQYHKARDSGKGALESLAYSAIQTGIEVATEIAGGKIAGALGTKTLEQMFSSKPVKGTLGRLLGVSIDGGSEVASQYLQNVTDLVSGVDPNAFDNLGEQTFETFAVGTLLSSAAHASDAAAGSVTKFMDNPTRENARAAGVPREFSESRSNREEIAKHVRETTEILQGRSIEDREALESIVAHRVRPTTKAGSRGVNQALAQLDAFSPEQIAQLQTPLSEKAFAGITGIKGTSKGFREGFADTLRVAQESVNPGQASAEQSEGPQSPPESSEAGSAPNTPPAVETRQTPSESPIRLTPPVEGKGTGNKLKTLAKKYLTSAGLRNTAIDRANDRMLGAVAENVKLAEQLKSDLMNTVRREFLPEKPPGFLANEGTRQPAPKINKQTALVINDALQGQPTTLPIDVLEAVEPLRAHIDHLSQQMIDAGITDDALTIKFDENLGSYVTRTYRKYTERNWKDTVKKYHPDKVAAARDWLREQFPDDEAAATEWRLNAMLDRNTPDSNGISEVQADSSFMNILKERKDLPEVIRELYGEHKDPWVNYTTSVAKMAQLLGAHQFGTEVRDAGFELGFLSDAEHPNPDNYRQIDAQKYPQLAPLSGLYTTPEIAEGLNDLFKPDTQAGFYRALMKTSGIAKWAQTVGNSKTHVRNFLANPLFAVANGDLGRGDMRRAFTALRDDFTRGGNAHSRAKIREYARAGFLDSNIDIGDVKAQIGTMADIYGDNTGIEPLRKGKQAVAALNFLYQGGDSVWKIAGYENKVRQFAKAFPDETMTQIRERAAQDIRNHYPTYSKIPQAVRGVSRTPFIGPFVSFSAESIRTLKNTATTITAELASDNAQLREMGKQRAVGVISSLLIPTSLSLISRAIWGIDPDEDDKLRLFQAPWSENSQSIYLGPGKDGVYETFDLSFMDPRAQLIKAAVGGLRSGDATERIDRATAELLAPLGEDLFFGKVVSAWRNLNPDGSQVYNPEASLKQKTKELTEHFGRVLQPGTIHQFERLRKSLAGEVSRGGKVYDPVLEAAALLGFRSSATDVRQSLGFKNRDFGRRLRNADDVFTSVLWRRGTVTPGELDEAYQQANVSRQYVLSKWHETAMAAVRLGVPVGEVASAIDEAVGRDKTKMIMAGVYRPYRPSNNAVEQLYQRSDGPDRVDHLVKLIREAEQLQ